MKIELDVIDPRKLKRYRLIPLGLSEGHKEEKQALINATLQQGIYFLFQRSEIVYIGKSEAVYTRVYRHRRYKKFDSFAYIPYSDRFKMMNDERDYIEEFEPKLNKNKGESYNKNIYK